MEKKDKLDIQDKMADDFVKYCDRLEKEAKNQKMSLKKYLEKKLSERPLGDTGKLMLSGNFFALNVAKAKYKKIFKTKKQA